MTGMIPRPANEEPVPTAERMDAIAAGLSAAGLAALVNQNRGAVDVTATVRPTGHREIEVTVDDDGYTQIVYWNRPEATPEQVTAIITGVLAVITGS